MVMSREEMRVLAEVVSRMSPERRRHHADNLRAANESGDRAARGREIENMMGRH